MSQAEIDEVDPRLAHLFKLIKIGLSVLLIGAVFIGISMGSLKMDEQNANQSAQSAIYNAEVQAKGILATDTCLESPNQTLCLQAKEIIDNPTSPITRPDTLQADSPANITRVAALDVCKAIGPAITTGRG